MDLANYHADNVQDQYDVFELIASLKHVHITWVSPMPILLDFIIIDIHPIPEVRVACKIPDVSIVKNADAARDLPVARDVTRVLD